MLRFRACVRLSQCGSRRGLHGGLASTVSGQPTIPPISRKEVQEVQIPVPWGHLSGKWWGRTDVQPVLLLHGWQDNAASFDALAPLLHNEALLAVDMVGHGLSSHYPLGQSYSYVDGIVNLRRIVKHFGWDRSVSFIGHSLGSLMAFGYAGMFPDAVEKFVSIDDIRGPLVLVMRAIAERTRKVIDANLSYEKKLTARGSVPSYTYNEILDLYWKGNHGSVTREASEIILERGITKMPGSEKYSFSRDPRLKVVSWDIISKDSVCAIASQITCEVLHIRASNSITGELPEALELYEETLKIIDKTAKRTEFHAVEGTHHVHLNNPELVAPLINNFFETKVDDIVC